MSSRLSVIFYIILCLEVGLVLTFLPWVHVIPFLPSFGLSDWGDNYFLVYAAHKTGLMSMQRAVSSGWVRGAVTGLGLLNLGIAFWEIAHFGQTVRAMQSEINKPALAPKKDAAQAPTSTAPLSHHERRDDTGDDSVK
ncbi:MAG TPA: hypothetical protein VIW80_08525 [Pyrinomonadaceae bacterium]|jgi:hypothetical protein